jgi:hypothetical protein
MLPNLRLILGTMIATVLVAAAGAGLLANREPRAAGIPYVGRPLVQQAIAEDPDAQHFALLAYARRTDELQRLLELPFAPARADAIENAGTATSAPADAPTPDDAKPATMAALPPADGGASDAEVAAPAVQAPQEQTPQGRTESQDAKADEPSPAPTTPAAPAEKTSASLDANADAPTVSAPGPSRTSEAGEIKIGAVEPGAGEPNAGQAGADESDAANARASAPDAGETKPADSVAAPSPPAASQEDHVAALVGDSGETATVPLPPAKPSLTKIAHARHRARRKSRIVHPIVSNASAATGYPLFPWSTFPPGNSTTAPANAASNATAYGTSYGTSYGTWRGTQSGTRAVTTYR